MNRFVTSRSALRGIAIMVVVAAVASGCGSAARRPPRGAPLPSVVAAPVRVAHTPAGGVSYRSVGAGPPLLLITGYPFSMDDWPPLFVDTLAEHYRSDVARLVLCATAPGNGRATPPTSAADTALARPNQALGLEKMLFPPDQQATEVPAFAGQIAQYPHCYRPPVVAERAQAAASLAWLSGHDPAGQRIGQITAPTLIGDGLDDQALPPANDRVLHADIPGSQLVLYPDAGHGFFFQDLHAWTDRIETFLGPGDQRPPG